MFKRHHSHSRSFRRVRLDERALRMIAGILAAAAARHERLALEIKVRTADGRETFLTGDPEFFLSPDMPRDVGSISMTSSLHSAPLEWDVHINDPYSRGVSVEVAGSNSTDVAGVFSELSRVLEAQLIGPNWLRFDRLSVGVRLAVGSAAAILAALCILPVIRLLLHFLPGSSQAIRLLTFPLVASAMGFSLAFVPDAVITSIDRAFPLVEFSGSLSDAGRAARKKLFWWGSAVLLPILLNVLAGITVSLLPSAAR